MNMSMSIEHPRKRVLIGKNRHTDIPFLKNLLKRFLVVLVCCWFFLVLLRSGDVHPNPGPSLSNASLYTDDANSSLSTPNDSVTKHLSFVHYNIQSLMQKLDVLYTGLREFDIIGFTET